MVAGQELYEAIFAPRGMGIIGASPHDIATLAHINRKIKDRLYLVNPNYTEVLGRKCYPKITDVEAPVDYVSIGVSAAILPTVLEDCIRKGVKVAQIFTAGYSETGLPEAIAREQELKRQAAGRIRLIGPNCFGVYCPKAGMSIIPEAPEEEGHIGVLAQSGGVTETFSYFAATKHLRFSKIVSYGNAVDLDGPDFLDFLADDVDTHLIAIYIEGTRDGERLHAALSRVAARKPVIAVKGGMTEQGMRAAASHTASLAGSPALWASVLRQSGAVQVETFEELMGAVMAFDKCPLPAGPSLAMITNSGGFSVIQTDQCVKEGIRVPRFSPETVAQLRKWVPLAGTSVGNPLDAWPIFYNIAPVGNFTDIAKLVGADPAIDALVVSFDQFRYLRRILGKDVGAHMERLRELMVTGCVHVRDVIGKPVLTSVSLDPYLRDEEDRRENLLLEEAFADAGLPVYAQLEAAVKALAVLCRYSTRKRQAF